MKLFIYPTVCNTYFKISVKPPYCRTNLGHITLAGKMSLKNEIVEMIGLKGVDFSESPGWRLAIGRSGAAGGTGYHSTASFGTVDAAVLYLRSCFDVNFSESGK